MGQRELAPLVVHEEERALRGLEDLVDELDRERADLPAAGGREELPQQPRQHDEDLHLVARPALGVLQLPAQPAEHLLGLAALAVAQLALRPASAPGARDRGEHPARDESREHGERQRDQLARFHALGRQRYSRKSRRARWKRRASSFHAGARRRRGVPLSIALPDAVGAAEDVEGPLDLLVLVRRVAPGEAALVLPPRVHDQQEIGEPGGEPPAVGDVDLHAAAGPARVLLERGREEHRPEAHAGQPLRVQGLARASRGRARARPPARTAAWCRVPPTGSCPRPGSRPGRRPAVSGVGMFGDGITQGRPVSSNAISRRQPRMRTTFRSTSSPRSSRNSRASSPDGQAVPHGQRVQAHEGDEPRVEQVAVHDRAAQRVGAVEHDQPPPVRGARLHRVQHRVDERVVARAHVLHVEHQRVDAGRASPRSARACGRRGCARAGPCAGRGVSSTSTRSCASAQIPCSGPNSATSRNARERVQRLRGVDEVGRHRGGVRDEPQALSAHDGRPREQRLQAGRDAGRGPAGGHSR